MSYAHTKLKINMPIEKVCQKLPNVGKVVKTTSKIFLPFNLTCVFNPIFVAMSYTVGACCAWVNLVSHNLSAVLSKCRKLLAYPVRGLGSLLGLQ